MTRRHDTKGDETVAFRVPAELAAGLRDRARWNRCTPSELMRRIIERELSEDQSGKPLQAFANISPDAIEAAIRAALAKVGMLPAGSKKRRAS